MSRLPRVPIAIATATAVVTATLAVLVFADTAGAAPKALDIRLVSTVDTSASYRSAITSDGEQTAYETDGTDRSVIKVGGTLGSGGDELPNGDTTATAPSISGDGNLVSFLGDVPGADPNVPKDLQLYVVNRTDTQNPTVKAVTATPGDLPYQRMVRCTINGQDNSDDQGCQPRLSRDGRTLVAPVLQSIDDAGVDVSVDGESLHTDHGLEPLMDLGAFSTSTQSTLTVKNTSARPITYPDTGPTIEGDTGFVASGTCAATLAVGASCTVTVKYSRPGGDCNAGSDATLRLPATSANGQTAIKLTAGGECPRFAAFPPVADAAAADACTGPSQYKWDLPFADDPQTSEARPHPYFAIGEVPAGELGIAAVRLHNSMAEPKLPTLTSSGCELKFVLPANADAEACHPGEAIPAQSSCVAYVEYKIAQVSPFVGSFHVGETVYRISGHASRKVIAAWRDPSATGTFGPAQVVSVSGPDGTPMAGTAPTVSANGRWIGYASTTALGRPETNPNAADENTQVYLHDTDSASDGTHQAGQTILVSQLADGSLPDRAEEPSVSDDGSRIAFSGWKIPPTTPSVATPRTSTPDGDHRKQVYVRDRAKDRTILVSANSDGTSANAFAEDPQLSGDGGTVVYRSSASNLGVGSLGGIRILDRDLTADLAGGRSSNELLSPRPDGAGSGSPDRFPTVNQNGTVASFTSDDQLLSQDSDTTSDVYGAYRPGHVTIEPATLDFGKVPVRTTAGPKPVTIHNDGQTVVTFDQPYFNSGRTEYKIVGDQCTDQPIRPGESCTYTVEFTPQFVGDRSGQFRINNQSGALLDTIYYDLSGSGTSDAKTVGQTSQVSTNDGKHQDPAISDNGQFVAYRTGLPSAEDQLRSIWTKDLKTNTAQQLSPATNILAVGPPTMSADGKRVAYAAIKQLGQAQTEYPRTVVADRSTPTVSEHEITGTTTDLRYQRPGACGRGGTDDLGTDLPKCRPSVSGDGRTVAFPARLDSSSPNLKLAIQPSDADPVPVTSLIDFGTGADEQLDVQTKLPIQFSGPPTIEGSNAFTIDSNSTCKGELAAGARCSILLSYNSCVSGSHTGILRIPGTTPDGQAAISLIGDPGCFKSAGTVQKSATKKAAACTPIVPPDHSPAESTAKSTLGLPLADVGGTPRGRTNYTSLLVEADTSAQQVDFGSDCDFAMVTPTVVDTTRPRPCVDGETLPANTSCTAYVGFRPETIDPAGTTLRTTGGHRYRFAGSGIQDVVLARTDTKGDGSYAGPPEIISKNSSGATIDGAEPALSGDGRYVAFVSAAPDAAQPGQYQDQIFRHDRVGGETVQVSQVPVTSDPAAGYGLSEPSISASGDRIAFITNGLFFTEGPGVPSQVYVRDVSTGKTVLASVAVGSDTKLGDDFSYQPSLSDDGSTVGFSSDATDLVTEPANQGTAVFVRYVDPDFDAAHAAQRFSERVSLTADGSVPGDGFSGSPALSSDGAFTAFDSTSQLVATDTDTVSDVYVRRRPAQLVVEPAAVDYGQVKVGTTAPARQMTVRNIGMGPATAGPSTTGAPFAAGGNLCKTTLHRGQSCVVDASFRPVEAGRADGLLTVPSVQGYLPGPSVSVTMTGTGTAVPPVGGFTVVPGKLVFGGTGLGKSSAPLKVVLRNTGGVPLEVKPTLTAPDGDFGADLTACAALMPGAQCEFAVTFAPRKTGQRTGSIKFVPSSQTPGVKSPAPVTVSLVGTGDPGPRVASMTVAPRTLLFGPQILLSNSTPRSIVVTNTGNVPLNVTGVSVNPDFLAVSTCRGIQPGKTCAIAVQFVPRSLGTRFGAVQVAATAPAGVVAPFPVPVGLRGLTAAPTLLVAPPVVQPGQIVLATGTNFPPGRPVVLGWQTGLGTQPVIADAKGHFQTAVLVFKRDVLGQRLLTGTLPGLPAPVLSPPVLVQPLSPQPPNFVLRW